MKKIHGNETDNVLYKINYFSNVLNAWDKSQLRIKNHAWVLHLSKMIKRVIIALSWLNWGKFSIILNLMCKLQKKVYLVAVFHSMSSNDTVKREHAKVKEHRA